MWNDLVLVLTRGARPAARHRATLILLATVGEHARLSQRLAEAHCARVVRARVRTLASRSTCRCSTG